MSEATNIAARYTVGCDVPEPEPIEPAGPCRAVLEKLVERLPGFELYPHDGLPMAQADRRGKHDEATICTSEDSDLVHLSLAVPLDKVYDVLRAAGVEITPSPAVQATMKRWSGVMDALAPYDSGELAKKTAARNRVTLDAIVKTMRLDAPDHHKLSAIAGLFEDREPEAWALAAERFRPPADLWGAVFSRWGYPQHVVQRPKRVCLTWDAALFQAELEVKQWPGADWWTVRAWRSRSVVGESVDTQEQAAALAPRLALLVETMCTEAALAAEEVTP